MNDEKNCLLPVFNPLNVVQTLYYGFSFGTIEYLSVGREGVKQSSGQNNRIKGLPIHNTPCTRSRGDHHALILYEMLEIAITKFLSVNFHNSFTIVFSFKRRTKRQQTAYIYIYEYYDLLLL